MQRILGFKITRRRFAFWIGFGLFTLAEKLRASALDELAAATMRNAEPKTAAEAGAAVHWRKAENKSWRWFERENLIDSRWVLTGITTPINKQSGERFTGATGYLDDSLVPAAMRRSMEDASAQVEDRDAALDDAALEDVAAEDSSKAAEGLPSAARRARHGRPPSRWLRSLNAEEIRIWLKTIDPPEADVSGMTYWTHLTRDHSFDPEKIEGLTIDEQAELHAAAHAGY